MTERPWLVLVGGFLGAGKTTLILAAARELSRRGLRSAAILNDQGADLVDTQLARERGLDAAEVTGGCFCCRFSDLLDRAEALRRHAPDVIFAEPVGSCTDIVATTILPLLADYSNAYRLAPFTVLVDPARSVSGDMEFLYRKQLEEADLVCFTKSDLGVAGPDIPGAGRLSARTGQGVAAWLDQVLSGELSAGGRTLEIDYDEYARAEAALAWLNLEVRIEPSGPTSAAPISAAPISAAMLLGPLLDEIDAGLTRAGIEIVHLKATDVTPEGFVKAAICANGREPDVEGNLDASPALEHRLRINLRAAGPPETVRNIVEQAVDGLEGARSDYRVSCFSPAPPKPERRITAMR